MHNIHISNWLINKETIHNVHDLYGAERQRNVVKVCNYVGEMRMFG